MDSSSLKKLFTCDPRLQEIIRAADEIYPIQVICGERGESDQNQAYANKKSKLKYPNSKHNINPKKGRLKSWAVDVVPDPDRNPKTISWLDLKQFEIMLLVIEKVAKDKGTPIRLGRDFKFKDFPHVELT